MLEFAKLAHSDARAGKKAYNEVPEPVLVSREPVAETTVLIV